MTSRWGKPPGSASARAGSLRPEQLGAWPSSHSPGLPTDVVPKRCSCRWRFQTTAGAKGRGQQTGDLQSSRGRKGEGPPGQLSPSSAHSKTESKADPIKCPSQEWGGSEGLAAPQQNKATSGEAPRGATGCPPPRTREQHPPQKKLTCPRPMGLGEGSDETNSVGRQREVLARAAVPVGHPPVQVQHVAQGWATCLPVGPVGPPCRWGLAEERLHQWEGENPRECWGRGRFVPTLCQAQLQGEQQHQEKQSPPRAPGAQDNHHSTRRRQPLRAGGTAATVPTGSGGASSPPKKDQQPGLQLLLGIHATMLGWGTPPGTAGLPPRCSNEMGRGTTTEAGLHRLEKGGLIHHHT